MKQERAMQEAVDAIVKEAVQAARANESVSSSSVREEQAAKKRRKEYQDAADFEAICVAAERANKWMGQSLAGSPLHIKTSVEKVIFNKCMETLKVDPDDECWGELAAVYKSLSDYAHVFPKLPFMLMNYYYTEWKGSQEMALSENIAKAESFFEKQFYPTPPYGSNVLGEDVWTDASILSSRSRLFPGTYQPKI